MVFLQSMFKIVIQIIICLLSFFMGAQSLKSNGNYKHYRFINFNKAEEVALQNLKHNQLTENKEQVSAYVDIIEIFYLKGEYKKAKTYITKALKIAQKNKDDYSIADLYCSLGNIELKQQNYNTALKHFLFAERIINSNKILKLKPKLNLGIARLNLAKNEIYTSKLLIDSLTKTTLKIKDTLHLARSYNIKGLLFSNTHKDSSLYYYNKALELSKVTNNKYLQGIVLSNLGGLYLDNDKFQEAFTYLKKAETITKAVGYTSGLFFIHLNLGVYYEHQEDYNKAIEYYKQALKYSDNITLFRKTRAYWLLSGALYHDNQFKEAFNYQEHYITLNDSLFSINKTKEFETIRTQYEVEKKDNQIQLLEKESLLAKTRRKWIVISSVLLLLPLIGLLFFYRHKIKTQRIIASQEKLQLQQQQHIQQKQALILGQDKERNRIAKELHDGIGGQLAAINLNLSKINSTQNNTQIDNVSNNLSLMCNELRNISHNLSTNYITQTPFNALLFNLKEKYSSLGLEVTINIFPVNTLEQLQNEVKHNIYRIIQELFNNIQKHAKAKIVQLSFNLHDTNLVIMLEDDGVGFSTKTVSGIGLANVNERVEALSGYIDIDSTINNGTTTIIQIPVTI